MILACEDSLGEAIVRKLIHQFRPELEIDIAIGKTGKDYLRSKARDLNSTASSCPVMLLIDADIVPPCPAEIINTWLSGRKNRYLLFRIAIMEIESWILADRENCSSFLSIPLNRIPNNTDIILDPKNHLINLARRSNKRNIREELVPAAGSTSSIGPAYNIRLIEFVTSTWNPEVARLHSSSLDRAINRLLDAFN